VGSSFTISSRLTSSYLFGTLVKNTNHLRDFPRFLIYYILRFLLIILLTILIFSLAYIISLPQGTARDLLANPQSWVTWTMDQQWALFFAQNIAQWVLAIYLGK
jgi:hypothetical protein